MPIAEGGCSCRNDKRHSRRSIFKLKEPDKSPLQAIKGLGLKDKAESFRPVADFSPLFTLQQRNTGTHLEQQHFS